MTTSIKTTASVQGMQATVQGFFTPLHWHKPLNHAGLRGRCRGCRAFPRRRAHHAHAPYAPASSPTHKHIARTCAPLHPLHSLNCCSSNKGLDGAGDGAGTNNPCTTWQKKVLMSSYREKMPTVTAWIDDVRSVFCTEPESLAQFNQHLRDGNFYAAENGHTLGRKDTSQGVTPVLPLKTAQAPDFAGQRQKVRK